MPDTFNEPVFETVQPAPQMSFQDRLQAQNAAPLMAPKRGGFGLRKILIGIVGAMFAVGLLAVVSDLWAQASDVPVTAQIVSAQDTIAQVAADAVIPDADPDRHWTDIDVTPIVEWYVAQFFLAMAEDMDAQVNIGMTVGGLFVVSFMVR